AQRTRTGHQARGGTQRGSPEATAGLPVLFFFERYGDHRDLHSFPTRRSSDLWSSRRRSCRRRPRVAAAAAAEGRDQDGDRKSTRLNSSHANISYAVFCLTK